MFVKIAKLNQIIGLLYHSVYFAEMVLMSKVVKHTNIKTGKPYLEKYVMLQTSTQIITLHYTTCKLHSITGPPFSLGSSFWTRQIFGTNRPSDPGLRSSTICTIKCTCAPTLPITPYWQPEYYWNINILITFTHVETYTFVSSFEGLNKKKKKKKEWTKF